MKRSTGLWLLAAAALIVIGLLVFGSVIAAHGWSIAALGDIGYETHTLDIKDSFSNIAIHSDTAVIKILPSEDGKCHVILREQPKVSHSVSVQDSTLSIELQDMRKWYERITLSFSSPRITVYLPQNKYASLLIRKSTGDVTIPDGFTFRDISINAGTGDVICSASASNIIEIVTSTGDIRTTDLRTGELNLSVSTGKVEARSISCDRDIVIIVSTGKAVLSDIACGRFGSEGNTGNITLTNVIATGEMIIKRTTGDIKLDKCDASALQLETNTGSVSGTLLSEKTFVTRTGTGRVRVPETTASGVCRVTTSTGNITFSVQ